MDAKWVTDTLDHLSGIGKTAQNGSNRLAFSPEDMAARTYFKDLMSEAGLAVREDAFGNIIGRLEGTDPLAPAVATGSHIDTVPNGGHYDGMVGSVAGLAAIKRLQKRGSLRHPLELIIFQMEESSRFSMATLGSKIMVGRADLNKCRQAKDKDGAGMPEVMAKWGYDFEKLPSAVRKKGEIAFFLEMHIEQSPTLEEKDLAVGIVTGIAAPIRLHIVVDGKASHSGGTAMNNRKDALVSASEMVLAVRTVANRFARRDIVATVGNLVVHPGAMNVVPGKVEFWVDLRGIDKTVMDEAHAALRKGIEGISAMHGTPAGITVLADDTPVRMTPGVIALMEEVSRDLGIPAMPIVSGAGHDTMNMADIAETGMIFLRCKDGLSHNPAEYAKPEDIMQGLELLTETLYRLAK